MNTTQITITRHGIILDSQTSMTPDELCRSCEVEQETIVELVREGIVDPTAPDVLPWCFSGDTLPRVKRALRLQRDLELNLAGVAFALELLDEIEMLRSRLKGIAEH